MSGVENILEGRDAIREWREKRLRMQARQNAFYAFMSHSFDAETLLTFIRNINYMVLMHMMLAAVSIFVAERCNISFDMHVSLLVSPIVFPLAFAINADFQRRDTLLENVAHFESSGMMLYFCMREWRRDTGLDYEWINSVHNKMKSLLFLLREYLFSEEEEKRKYILRAMYEDFSHANQLIEQMRTSKLQSNGPFLARVIHFLSLMSLALERLRVVKEYRSPRSIRAFNKVLILFLPIFTAPYFVYLGRQSNNSWAPYFVSVLVAFVFATLQGVQDQLDDPFDGVGEDDIRLSTIAEWTLNNNSFKARGESPTNASWFFRSFMIGDFVSDVLRSRFNSESSDKPRSEPSEKAVSFTGMPPLERTRSRTLSFTEREEMVPIYRAPSTVSMNTVAWNATTTATAPLITTTGPEEMDLLEVPTETYRKQKEQC